MASELDCLWTPLAIGTITIENRVAVSAHDPLLDRERYAAYSAHEHAGAPAFW